MTPPNTEVPDESPPGGDIAVGVSPHNSDSPEGVPTLESNAYHVPTAFARVTVRTDVPPKMKCDRGRLTSIAFNIRKNNNLAISIRIFGSKVFTTNENSHETERRNA